MRKITIECFIGINEDIKEQDIGNYIQPIIEKLANIIMEDQEIEGYGFSARGSSDEEILNTSNKKLIYTLESKDIDSTFKDRFLVESYPYYAIRVPVEGDESHKKRFELMEEVIKRSGISELEDRQNCYFIFDTGKAADFDLLASSILLNPTNSVKNYAVINGITFCQWINKGDRDKLIRELGFNSELQD